MYFVIKMFCMVIMLLVCAHIVGSILKWVGNTITNVVEMVFEFFWN